MEAPLEAQLNQLQKQSIAHAIHFVCTHSEVYYEAVRRAAHLAGARPEMFLLRAVFALDLTRIAVPRGGAIPLASLPNAATEHPKLRRAVPQLFSGLEQSFQETLQRLVGSIDVHRQFVAWITVEGEGMATHDLGRSVHAGAVIDALDHRPTWVGHLGGRIGSGGDNMVPPNQFTTTADGRVVPNVGAAKQQQQQMMMMHQQHQQQLAAAQQRFGPQAQAIPTSPQQQQQYYQDPNYAAAAAAQQQPPQSAAGAGAAGVNSPWGMVSNSGGGSTSNTTTPQHSAISGMTGNPNSANDSALGGGGGGAGGQSPSTSLFGSGGAGVASPQSAPTNSRYAANATATAAAAGNNKSTTPGGKPGGKQAAGAGGGSGRELNLESLDKVDEFLAVSHMCTKASTKCIEQLGTFNVRLDELHNYTSSLQDKFESGRTVARDLSSAVEQLMQRLQQAERHMLLLESPKPLAVTAPKPAAAADDAAAEGEDGKPKPVAEENAAAAAAAAPAPATKPATSTSDRETQTDPPPQKPRSSNLDRCPYCDTPGTKFCPESGRRHETADEKTDRRWKTVFRQMALMSSFVSKVRLNKKNTCVDDSGVMLLL